MGESGADAAAGSGSRKFIPPSVSAWERMQAPAAAPEREMVRLTAGEQVRHNVFGLGTVLQANADGRTGIVVVRFKDAKGKPVDKTLDTAFAKLEAV